MADALSLFELAAGCFTVRLARLDMARAFTGILALTGATGRRTGTLAFTGIAANTFPLRRTATLMGTRHRRQRRGCKDCGCGGRQRETCSTVFAMHKVFLRNCLMDYSQLCQGITGQTIVLTTKTGRMFP
jgi:hypothetical protein